MKNGSVKKNRMKMIKGSCCTKILKGKQPDLKAINTLVMKGEIRSTLTHTGAEVVEDDLTTEEEVAVA